MRHETIEEPSGKGQIFDGDKSVASVRYDIEVRQSLDDIETFTEIYVSRGKDKISDHITIIDGKRDFFDGKTYQLHLEDEERRILDFHVIRVDDSISALISGQYSILSVRGLYFVEEE